MKTTTRTATVMAVLALGGALGAQVGRGTTTPTTDDLIQVVIQTQGEHVRAWDGRTKLGDGVYLSEAPVLFGQPTKYEQLTKRLAEIRVMIDVDRAFTKAGEELDDVWLRASSSTPFAKQGTLLVDVAVCRSYLYRTTGRPQAAFDTLLTILPDVRDPRWKAHMSTLVAPPKALADLANR